MNHRDFDVTFRPFFAIEAPRHIDVGVDLEMAGADLEGMHLEKDVMDQAIEDSGLR